MSKALSVDLWEPVLACVAAARRAGKLRLVRSKRSEREPLASA